MPAAGECQLGRIRSRKGRYEKALAPLEEARKRFAQLNEPGSVAVSWDLTGLAYQNTGRLEAAEDAYRISLAISVRLGDVAGQARTLNHLGTLYQGNRPQEAPAFHRQAANKYVEIGDSAGEGDARSNLGEALRKLGHLDEARKEIYRAFECQAAEPWTAWGVLADVESDAGNLTDCAKGKRKAIEAYLAYRGDGGENHSNSGRVALAVAQSLIAGKAAEPALLLEREAADYEAVGFGGFIRALQAIVAGSRDRTLADAPGLHYTMAAEILFLIETLERLPHG